MKLYTAAQAPNPRRVRIFMAEKGLSIPTVEINVLEEENLSEEFRAVNPRGLVPVLELDDGTTIDESVAICQYLEDLHPEPNLMGRDPLGKAIICSWQRHVEFDGYQAVAAVFRNSFPFFKSRAVPGLPAEFPAIPELVDRGRRQYGHFLEALNTRLGDSNYIAGPDFSITDITGLVAIDFGRRVEMDIPGGHTHTRRWYERVAGRPSAGA